MAADFNALTPNGNNLTTCFPGQVWDVKHHRLQRRIGILPDAEMTETPTRSQARTAAALAATRSHGL